MVSKHEIPGIFSTLPSFFSGDIDAREVTLTEGSRDASHLAVQPQLVVYPKNKSDIRGLLLFLKEKQLPLGVRGNGKSTSGGSLTEGLQINMSRHFTSITSVDPIGGKAIVSAGANVQDVVKRFTDLGVSCPLLTEELYGSSVGGVVAENAHSAATSLLGDMRLWVEGVSIILDDGEEYQIQEGVAPSGCLLEIYTNAFPLLASYRHALQAQASRPVNGTVGYNTSAQAVGVKQLLDIVVGSEGTLGIITSVTLRIVPLKKHSYDLFIETSSLHETESLSKLLAPSFPDAIFCFDKTVTNAFLHTKGYAFSYTEPQGHIVLARFSHKEDERAKALIDKQLQKIPTHKVRILPTHKHSFVEDYFLQKEEFKRNAEEQELLRVTTYDGIAFPETNYLSGVTSIKKILDDLQYPYLLELDPLSSRASFSFFVQTKTRYDREALEKAMRDIAEIIKEKGGAVTAGNGDGIARTPYMPISLMPEIASLYKDLQKLFDPEQIFNNGKKTFITNDYLVHHLVHTKQLHVH